jgi:hypothetical protein
MAKPNINKHSQPMKNGVSWDVAACGTYKNRVSGNMSPPSSG